MQTRFFKLVLGFILISLGAACAPIELSPTSPPAASAVSSPAASATVPPTNAPSATAPAATAVATLAAPTDTPPAAPTTLPATVPPTPIGELVGGQPQGGLVPAELLQQALADLTQRTGAPTADVQVVESESVLWNDGSLGCPQPGVAYTQAPVDGYRLLLSVQGQLFDYRASTQFVLLCEGVLPRPKP